MLVKRGDMVTSSVHGEGIITRIDPNVLLPIEVMHGEGKDIFFKYYNMEGVSMDGGQLTLLVVKKEESSSLTKREQFAMAAMQGMLSTYSKNVIRDVPFDVTEICVLSVELADKLIEELNK